MGRYILSNLKRSSKEYVVVTSLIMLSILVFLIGNTFTKSVSTFTTDYIQNSPGVLTLLVNPSSVEYESILSAEFDKTDGFLGLEGIIESGVYIYPTAAKLSTQLGLSSPEIGQLNTVNLINHSKIYNRSIVETVEELSEVRNHDFYVYVPLKSYEFEVDGYTRLIGQRVTLYIQIGKDDYHSIVAYVAGAYDNALTQDSEESWLIQSDYYREVAQVIYPDNPVTYYVSLGSLEVLNEAIEAIKRIDNGAYIRQRMMFDTLDYILIASAVLTKVLSAILIIVSLLYISSMTLKNIENNKIEIAVMKVIGYDNQLIKAILIIQNMLMICVGTLLGTCLYVIVTFVANRYIDNLNIHYLKYLTFSVDFLLIIAVSAVSVILTFAITYSRVNSFVRYETIDLLKEV